VTGGDVTQAGLRRWVVPVVVFEDLEPRFHWPALVAGGLGVAEVTFSQLDRLSTATDCMD
jgi:hypothetical protein